MCGLPAQPFNLGTSGDEQAKWGAQLAAVSAWEPSAMAMGHPDFNSRAFLPALRCQLCCGCCRCLCPWPWLQGPGTMIFPFDLDSLNPLFSRYFRIIQRLKVQNDFEFARFILKITFKVVLRFVHRSSITTFFGMRMPTTWMPEIWIPDLFRLKSHCVWYHWRFFGYIQIV